VPEEDARETIATFTLRPQISDDEIDEHALRYGLGPSVEELQEELRAGLTDIGISPSEAGTMAEDSFADGLLPDPAEEKRLRAELERAVAELGIPLESVAPAPED
jgi:hypothetical protein